MNPIYELDRATQAFFQLASLQGSTMLHGLATAYNWWGGSGVIYFGAVTWLGGRAAGARNLPRAALRGIECLAIASAVSGIIKGLAGRARPFVAGGDPGSWNFNHGWTNAQYFSMPSGHTTATVAFAVGASLVAWQWKGMPRVSLLVFLWVNAALVAFARLYSNQHWLSDVFVGTLLGAATSVALFVLHKRHPGSKYDRWMLGA